MSDIIWALNHALDMGKNRLQWYTITKDENHMKECREWNSIANMYMNQIIMEQKNNDD